MLSIQYNEQDINQLKDPNEIFKAYNEIKSVIQQLKNDHPQILRNKQHLIYNKTRIQKCGSQPCSVCGGRYNVNNKSNHMKTQKHLRAI